MTQKLRGNYNNKLEDYKKPEISRTQKHCLRFIRLYSEDEDLEALNRTGLAELADGVSESKIFSEVDDLIERGLVREVGSRGYSYLEVTDEATKHL